MAMGKRRRPPKQTSIWIATKDLPRTAAHPFHTRLNLILDTAGFDGYVESLCHRFYADEIGRPGLPPQRYFRLLLIGYFEGLDAERAIAWRAADSFALREFLGLVLPRRGPQRPFCAHFGALAADHASVALPTTHFRPRTCLDRAIRRRPLRRADNGFHHGLLGAAELLIIRVSDIFS